MTQVYKLAVQTHKMINQLDFFKNFHKVVTKS